MGQGRFETMGDNVFKILNKMSKNQELCRLLKYQVRDPFSTSLSSIEGDTLINKELRIVPQIPDEDEEIKSFIIILFEKLIINPDNTDFKITTIRFDIACPFDSWLLDNQSLRPFRIMNCIDEDFNKKRLSGLGTLSFLRAEPLVLSSTLGGYTLTYQIDEFN